MRYFDTVIVVMGYVDEVSKTLSRCNTTVEVGWALKILGI